MRKTIQDLNQDGPIFMAADSYYRTQNTAGFSPRHRSRRPSHSPRQNDRQRASLYNEEVKSIVKTIRKDDEVSLYSTKKLSKIGTHSRLSRSLISKGKLSNKQLSELKKDDENLLSAKQTLLKLLQGDDGKAMLLQALGTNLDEKPSVIHEKGKVEGSLHMFNQKSESNLSTSQVMRSPRGR